EETIIAIRAGGADYIRKDNFSRLTVVVERELRAAHLRRENQQLAEIQREGQARRSAILESALDCIVTIDHEGKIFEWNRAAENTFGYRRSEALGKVDRKSTRLNSSHDQISYAVFCLKKKKKY